MSSLRTKATHDSYEEHKKAGHLERGCPLCSDAVIEQYKHWKILDNRFPYDKISHTHHMIIPKRHVIETELTQEERDELIELKNSQLTKMYSYILEALPGQKSIPAHFHLHLIIPKDEI